MVKDKDIRITMNNLKAIFERNNNWETFLQNNKGKARPIIRKEVEKFLHCENLSNGFRTYKCEACPKVMNVPLRCKGKFCPTCAVGQAQRWAEIQANDMYRTIHRHAVFTIDEGLRPLFASHYRKKLLKGRMDEADRLMTEWFETCGCTPGLVVALHTFGSKLEYNPHIHMLVTMGGVTDAGEWKEYNFFPYKKLRKQWQTVVLKRIRRVLSERAKKQVQPLLQKAWKGFYINAPKRSRTAVKGLLGYIGRYMKRGPIALHRILYYDGETVGFHYMDKRENEWRVEELPVQEFIGRLVRHIPDEQFKMIRHYGLYSRRKKTVMKKVVRRWQQKVNKVLVNIKRMKKPKKWRERIKETFGRDPLKCSDCGNVFVFRGIAVRKNGKLRVQFANDELAHKYIKREIETIESKAYEHKKKEATRKAVKECWADWKRIEQKALESID